MYCGELSLALEYDGAHHYHFTPHFHKTQAAFLQQQWLDRQKEYTCAENGVHLIRLPYNLFERVQLTHARHVPSILRVFLSNTNLTTRGIGSPDKPAV